MGLVLFAAASFAIYKADVQWRAKKHRALEDIADDLAIKLASLPPPRPCRPSRRRQRPLAMPRGRRSARLRRTGPLLDLDALDALDVVSPDTPAAPEAHAVA